MNNYKDPPIGTKRYIKELNQPIPAPYLTGRWRYPLLQQLVDDRLAISMGLTDNGGKTVIPHGTYTDLPTFTVFMSDIDTVVNAILDIFDEHGNFCRFLWNGVDTWNCQSDPVTYNFVGDSNAKPPFPPSKIERHPNLLLARYDSTKGPWEICPSGPMYISISGDGSSVPAQPLPDQCITYNEDTGSFVWHLGKDWGPSTTHPDPKGLEFRKAEPQQPMPKKSDNFGNVFVAQSGLSQLDFPFYGFDPRHMDIFTLTGGNNSGSGTGTPSNVNKQNEGQGLTAGALIFQYPPEDSKNYIQGSDLAHQPYLPLGTYPKIIESGQGVSSSQMTSTLADTSHSWSITLGLSAGIEGLMSMGGKGTYGETIEEQRKNESRFTITRNYNIYWVCFTDRLTMKMVEDFRKEILDRLTTLMSGNEPEWVTFVTTYGTHYLYAMTQGDMKFSITEFTFEAQAHAFSNSIDISSTSEGVVEGVKIKDEAEFKNELKKKTGIDFSNEMAHYFSIGEPNTPGVGIFYDLRPLTELMSPIFFQYDPDDSVQKFAPWVWYDLRQSFSNYLESIGLNKPLDESFLHDFTPHRYKVTIQSFQLRPVKQTGFGEKIMSDGAIKFGEIAGHSYALQLKNLDIPWPDGAAGGKDINSNPYVPDPGNVFGTFIGKGGNEDPLSINLSVEFKTWLGNIVHWEQIGFHMSNQKVDFTSPPWGSDKKVRTVPLIIHNQMGGKYFDLSISLQAEDLGPVFH